MAARLCLCNPIWNLTLTFWYPNSNKRKHTVLEVSFGLLFVLICVLTDCFVDLHFGQRQMCLKVFVTSAMCTWHFIHLKRLFVSNFDSVIQATSGLDFVFDSVSRSGLRWHFPQGGADFPTHSCQCYMATVARTECFAFALGSPDTWTWLEHVSFETSRIDSNQTTLKAISWHGGAASVLRGPFRPPFMSLWSRTQPPHGCSKVQLMTFFGHRWVLECRLGNEQLCLPALLTFYHKTDFCIPTEQC